MKHHLVVRLRLIALLVMGVMVITASIAPQYVEAQSAPEKIRLMADALRARDSGDLLGAKAKAEELIKLAPSDQNVQRLLASINRDLDREMSTGGGQAPVFGQSPSTTVDEAMTSSLASLEEPQTANAFTSPRADAFIDEVAEEQEDETEFIYDEAKELYDAAEYEAAAGRLAAYEAAGGSGRKVSSLSRRIESALSNPKKQNMADVSPEFVAQNAIISELLVRGRAQFLNGDYDGAKSTFQEVEARDANNSEAKLFQTRIATILGDIHAQNLYKTRQQMLTEVDQQWERPKVFDVTIVDSGSGGGGNLIQDKLNAIVIPQVNFSGMELTRVIETLSELSVVYDADEEGVNIIPLFDANARNPQVSLSLRNLSLDRILQFVTQQVNFAYDVGGDAVTIQPSDSLGGSATTQTEFFPISRATVIRLTGFDGGGGSSGPVDPFAAPIASAGSSQNDETQELQNFFQSAGVNFELPGSSLAFDGDQLIVTQTRRNLERMRTILRNYNEVKQVEIEAKFLEVTQNDLEEFGFNWSIQSGANPVFDSQGLPVLGPDGQQLVNFDRQFSTGNNRSLNSAFGISNAQSDIVINGETVGSNAAPVLSNVVDLASNVGNAFSANGWTVNGYDVDFAIRALARKSGTDLMSAPKVTVLNGEEATITVAQELLFPTSYGDIESTASSSGGGSGGSTGGGSSISITAGTPQDFEARNVGVEMFVKPTVANDDTITLELRPRVTEFEGFVEYGGPSIAISDGTTVTVPAGFYQPVFSTREISTQLTIYDGATVVMGGLTRDQVKTVNDKVPVLGDIPGVGRLFRSEGETRQKRNLLIFVTANLVSPGGSPARQSYRNVDENSLFQNPTILTPSGSSNRSIPADAQ